MNTATMHSELNQDTAIRKIRLGVAAVLMAAAAPALGEPPIKDEFVPWPSLGYFSGYPLEKEREQSRPFRFYGTADIGYDDNFFRLSDESNATVFGTEERGEAFARIGGGARADLNVSRQQFTLDAHAERYMFSEFSDLNTTVYGANAKWLWALGRSLGGELGYAHTVRLPDFADVQVAREDLVTEQYGHASLNLRFLQRIELRALAEESRYKHDAPALRVLDNTVQSGTGGVFYVTPTMMSFGVQHRVSDGDYPVRQPIGTGPNFRAIDNRYRETESSIVLTKEFDNPGGLQLEVGRTERVHEDLPQRDFDGATGSFNLRYGPTPKVILEFNAYRDLRSVEEFVASYALVRGARIGPAWAPSVKTVFQFSYIFEQRRFDGDPLFALANLRPRDDRTQAARIAAGYTPHDNIQIGLSYERGKREANILFADFNYNLVLLHVIAWL